ncbi:hypothetical protein C7271_20180 [filamentous cyanobacterium CCP5]|nr:hypothetical protein C7271_20180 [filamentous cyanobacterium CCP5]
MASTPVDIVQSNRRLTFTEANIAIRLGPGSCPLMVVGHPQKPLSNQPLPEDGVTLTAFPKVETRSR